MNYLKLLNKDNITDICSYLAVHEVLIVCQMRDYIDVELLEKMNSELFNMKLVCSICMTAEYVKSIGVNEDNRCPICTKYFCVDCKKNLRSLETCDNPGCDSLYHNNCITTNTCGVCNEKMCYSENRYGRNGDGYTCNICNGMYY